METHKIGIDQFEIDMNQNSFNLNSCQEKLENVRSLQQILLQSSLKGEFKPQLSCLDIVNLAKNPIMIHKIMEYYVKKWSKSLKNDLISSDKTVIKTCACRKTKLCSLTQRHFRKNDEYV